MKPCRWYMEDKCITCHNCEEYEEWQETGKFKKLLDTKAPWKEYEEEQNKIKEQPIPVETLKQHEANPDKIYRMMESYPYCIMYVPKDFRGVGKTTALKRLATENGGVFVDYEKFNDMLDGKLRQKFHISTRFYIDEGLPLDLIQEFMQVFPVALVLYNGVGERNDEMWRDVL